MSAILDATIQVLDREGPDAATTSRIAEVAGVSIGTLYQYFAHKDAILDALQDREFERASQMLAQTLGRGDFASARDLTRAVLGGLLTLYRAAPGLHRVLAVQGLRVTPAERVAAFDRQMVDRLRGFFEITPFGVVRKNKHVAAFVLYQSVRAVMLAGILEEPEGVTDDSLIDEVTDMITAHLVGG